MKVRNTVDWVLRLLTAAILFQTLFFKFSGSAESVYIFTRLGLEPWGRIGSGIAELVACVLLLYPPTVVYGAGLALGVISGAISSHLTRLGIVVLDDGGTLFVLALIVFGGSAALLWLHRADIPWIGPRMGGTAGNARGHDHDGASREGRPACRVVVVGGGFGGTYTALALDRAIARGDDIEVTLVNRENFFLFTPMLHEVAASDLDFSNIVSPLRKLLRHVDFYEGEVQEIDLDARKLRVCHGADRHSHEIEYDRLVIALGSITRFPELPGLEHALKMKSLGDAVALRNRVIARLEEADTECAAAVRTPLLTFVVAGGGFAGVETIAGINDFVHDALHYYPHLDDREIRMVLVHSGPVVLPELGEKLGRYAQKKLAARGVEIRTNVRVAAVSADRVELSDGTRIDSRTLVWTAGTGVHPLVERLPCEKVGGRIRVDETLAVAGSSGVWALGDCAAVHDPLTGGFHPPTAQHALRQGRVVARNVLASVRGGRHVTFRFRTLGQLAAIGHRTGVARILGVTFSGFFAWWLWRTIYLAKLPRFEKKLRVALDWTLDVFFSKDLVQLGFDRATTRPRSSPAIEIAESSAASNS